MRRLWTPDQGASGLIVVARQRPLLLVMGGQLVENTGTPPEPSRPLRETRSATGLIILSKSAVPDKPRIVGHPDLATQTRYRRGDTLYVSISEALWLETQGEDVELHFEPDANDKDALAEVQQKVRRRWENDRLPDGWTRRSDSRPDDRNRIQHHESASGHPAAERETGSETQLSWDEIRQRLLEQRNRRFGSVPE